MIQLTYISTARAATDDLYTILAVSRRNNRRDGITGLLLFNGKRFLQAIEGPEAMVEAAYGRIEADPRHCAAVMLSKKTVEARQFGSWDMACERTMGGAASLTATVDELIAGVADPNVRALFASYVRLQTAA